MVASIESVTERLLQSDLIIADAVDGAPTMRRQVALWVAHRAQNPSLTTKEIAERIGVTTRALYDAIAAGTRAGWLKIADPLDRLEYEILPKTLDNLNHFLDKQDRVVTVETAKGTLFKQFQAEKGISEQVQTVLALKIEPAEGSEVKVVTGQIVGKPREL